MTVTTPLSVLAVEDNEIDWMALVRRFREYKSRFHFRRAETVAEATALLGEISFDCVLLDLNLPDGRGVDLLPELTNAASIVMTGQGEAMVAVDAMKRGASDFVVKQADGEHLTLLPEVLERAHQRKSAARELERYRSRLEQMVAERTQRLQAEVEWRLKTEEDLKSLLEVKETLLQEVHHRVKNNLQIISSLLNLQADSSTGGANDLLHASSRRIQAMALVHEQIYQSPSLSDVNLIEYLNQLCLLLADAYGGAHVDLHIESDEIRIDLKAIIPLALIATELLSNAYKYAFEPDAPNPSITVIGKLDPDGQLILTISDNGKGTPEAVLQGHGETLGLTIVHLLADQLHGSVQHSGNNGTTWEIRVPVN
jgi:two-component sensor histidine kinase